MKKYLFTGIILFLLLALNTKVFSQKINIDSLIHITQIAPDDTNKVIAFRAVCGATANTNPKQSMAFGWNGVKLAKKIEWDKGVAGCYLNLSNAYSNLGEYDSAIILLDSALVYSLRVGEEKRIALVYINRASSYIYLNRLDRAMQDGLEALTYAEKTGDVDRTARVNMLIGNIYFYQEDWQNAAKFYQTAKPLFLQISNENMVGTITMNLAMTFKNRGELDTAEALIRESIGVFSKGEDFENLGLSYTNLGTILKLKNQLDQAEKALESAVFYAEQIEDVQGVIANKQSLAEIYFLQKKYSLAESMLKPIFKIAVDNGFYKEQQEIASTISEVYAATGDYELAYEYLIKYNIAKDTFEQRKQNEVLLDLQQQYNATQREKEIELLNTKTELQQKEIERKNLVNILLALVFIVIVVGGLILLNRYRLKQQLNQVHLRNKIASDLHDDVGATLSSIKMYSEIIKQDDLATNGKNQLLLQKIIENSAESIENMSDIVWMVKPGNDKLENLTQRMLNFAGEMCRNANMKLNVQIEPDLGDVVLPMELRRDVYLIVKEAVNNAAKYSKGKNLTLKLFRTSKLFNAEINDDGIGFDATTGKLGNGQQNMQNRALKHKGKLEVKTAPNEGCSIKLVVPIT